MKAIIIAAGNSSRLEGIAKDLPKGLLKIGQKSIIQRQIDFYRKNDINEIIIVTGPNSEKFNFENVIYVHDDNHDKHDVLGSLMAAREFMKEGFIMSYSDIIFEEEILKEILKFNGKIGIALDFNWREKYVGRTNHPLSEADNVLMQSGKIVKTKKFLENDLKENIYEFLPIIILSQDGANIFIKRFEELEKTHEGKFHEMESLDKAVLTDMLQELIDLGVEISPIKISNKWCEIDTQQDFEIAKNVFSQEG